MLFFCMMLGKQGRKQQSTTTTWTTHSPCGMNIMHAQKLKFPTINTNEKIFVLFIKHQFINGTGAHLNIIQSLL